MGSEKSWFSRFRSKDKVTEAPTEVSPVVEMTQEHPVEPGAESQAEVVPEPAAKQETRKLSIPEKELAELEGKLTELKLIEQSLVLESRSNSHAQEDVYDADRNIEKEAAALIDVGVRKEGELDGEDKEGLLNAHAEKKDAQEWLETTEQNPTVAYAGHRILEEGPLKDKLESLGVSIKKHDSYFHDPVEGGISQRITELESLVKQKKLEVPGGREEMIVEVVSRKGFLDENRLDNYNTTLTKARDGDPYAKVAGVFGEMAPAAMNGARWYPLEVQQGVLSYMARKVMEKIPGAAGKSEEVEKALEDYLLLETELESQKGKSREAEEAIKENNEEISELKENLERLKERVGEADTDPVLSLTSRSASGREFNILQVATDGTSEGEVALWGAAMPQDVADKFKKTKKMKMSQVTLTMEVAIRTREEAIRTLGNEKVKLDELKAKHSAAGSKKIGPDFRVTTE